MKPVALLVLGALAVAACQGAGKVCTTDYDCAGEGADMVCLSGRCGVALVRPPVANDVDAGIPTASVLELNGILAAPGIPLQIAPAPVATSPKFYLRKSSGNSPICWYGVFVADPAAAGQPNNGLLLVSKGNMQAINSDPNLGGAGRTSCPDPQSYTPGVGGGIPDNIQVGDQLVAYGQLAPYCDYYDTSAGQCAADPFPEFQVDPSIQTIYGTTVTGQATAPAPLVVDPSAISDESATAIQYAGELVQVQNVTVSNPNAGYGDMVLEQGQLWLSPLTSAVVIPAQQGEAIASLTGVLHYQFQHWLLRPRTQADVCLAAPCP